MGYTDSPRLGAKITWKQWDAAILEDKIRPSDYARTMTEEDFSETLVMYQKVKGTPYENEFRSIMPARFALMDKILQQ